MQSYSLKPLDRKKENNPFAVQIEWDDNWDKDSHVKGKDKKYIHFNMKDKTYNITDSEVDSSPDVISLFLPIDDNRFFLLSCYDNGYVNKIPVSSFSSDRENWTYRNAFYPKARLQAFLFGSEDDYVYCEMMYGNWKYVKAVSIKDIPIRCVKYTKGYRIIDSGFNSIDYWNIIVGKDINNVQSIVYKTIKGMPAEWLGPEEKAWLRNWKYRYDTAKRYDANLKSLKPILLDAVFQRNQKAIESVLLKQKEVDIASCQDCIEKLVCNDLFGEDYWFFALTALKVNAEYYARPVTIPIIHAEDKTKYVVKDLGQYLDKLSMVLFDGSGNNNIRVRFFLCFKSFVSEDCKVRIQHNSKCFKSPDDYDSMFKLLGLSSQNEVGILLKDNTITSIFVLTKMYVSNYGKKTRRNSFFRMNGDVSRIMSQIDDTSVYGRVSIQLLSFVYYHQSPKTNYNAIVDLSKVLEYAKYTNLCSAIESQDKAKEEKRKAKLVGKKMRFVVTNKKLFKNG